MNIQRAMGETRPPTINWRHEIIRAEAMLLAVEDFDHFHLEIDWSVRRAYRDALAAAITKARLRI